MGINWLDPRALVVDRLVREQNAHLVRVTCGEGDKANQSVAIVRLTTLLEGIPHDGYSVWEVQTTDPGTLGQRCPAIPEENGKVPKEIWKGYYLASEEIINA